MGYHIIRPFDNLSRPCLIQPFLHYNFSKLPYQLTAGPLYLYYCYDSLSALPVKEHFPLDDYISHLLSKCAHVTMKAGKIVSVGGMKFLSGEVRNTRTRVRQRLLILTYYGN